MTKCDIVGDREQGEPGQHEDQGNMLAPDPQLWPRPAREKQRGDRQRQHAEAQKGEPLDLAGVRRQIGEQP